MLANTCIMCKSNKFIISSPRGHNNWRVACENGHPWTPGVYDEPKFAVRLKSE